MSNDPIEQNEEGVTEDTWVNMFGKNYPKQN